MKCMFAWEPLRTRHPSSGSSFAAIPHSQKLSEKHVVLVTDTGTDSYCTVQYSGYSDVGKLTSF